MISKNISTKEHQHRDLSTTLRFGRDDNVDALSWKAYCLGSPLTRLASKLTILHCPSLLL
jgi:hypothetical protein